MSSIKDQMNKYIEFLSIIKDDRQFVNSLELALTKLNINAVFKTVYVEDSASNTISAYYLKSENKAILISTDVIHKINWNDEYAWRRAALIDMIQAIKD